MDLRLVRRLTGACGVAAGLIATAPGPLYFMYSGAPPTWNVLTRNLLNLLAVAALVVFLAGLRALVVLGWGNTALTAGLLLYWAAAVGIAAMLPARDGGTAG